MTRASYRRGSQLIAKAADVAMPVAQARANAAAGADEARALRARIASLERDLGRARRCIWELRRSKDARLEEARKDAASSAFAISTLCRIAFPHDKESPP